MKIVTLNCQRSYRKQALKEFFSQPNKDDILLLQEFDQSLAPLFENNFHIVSLSKKEDRESESTVVLCVPKDIEIMEVFRVPFERQITQKHTYTFGAVYVLTKSHLFVSLHMPAYFQIMKRQKYLKRVLKEVEEYISTHCIVIGGDWNAFAPFEKIFIRQSIGIDFKAYIPSKNTYDGSLIEPGLFWNNILIILSIFLPMRFKHDFFISNSILQVQTLVLDDPLSDHCPVVAIV